MDIRININTALSGKKKQDQRTTRGTDFPTNPRHFMDDPEYILDVSFFDGSTTIDPTSDDGWKVVSLYDFPNIQTNESYTSRDGAYFIFFQNSNGIDSADLTKEWDGSDPNKEYSIFERMPMERILYQDFLDNQEVIPVGVSRPNMEVGLLYPDGAEATVVDHKRIFRGTVQGATADVIADDDTSSGYRIWEPPFYVGHIRVKEKTSNAVINYIDAEFDPYWDIVHNQQTASLEGIFWLPFDTSDTDNYKITKDPSYDAEAFLEPPVKMISQYTKLRVYLQPRKWWVWIYEKDGNQIKAWGLWMRPPRDFKLPTPRKAGNWELAHSWEIETDPYPPYTRKDESNAHARFDFRPGDGDADSDDRNGIYTLFSYHCMHTLLSGDWDDTYHCPWAVWELANNDQSWYYMYELLATEGEWIAHKARHFSDSGHPLYNQVQTTIFRTMPDLKCPVQFSTVTFTTKDRDGEEGPERTVRAYNNPDNGGFNQDGKDEVQKIWDYILESKALEQSPYRPTDNKTSWGIAAAGVKEGDLVAVIECGDGQPLYIWSKTDQDFLPEDDVFPTETSPNPGMYFTGMPENADYSGNVESNTFVVNCRGVLEWRMLEASADTYKFNRIIRKWGSWFDVPTEYDEVVPHRETIELEQPVSIIAYFGVFPQLDDLW